MFELCLAHLFQWKKCHLRKSSSLKNVLTRLANTLQYNLDRQNTEKRLERSVFSDRGLPSPVIPIFEKHVRERVTELLIDLDNWLSPYTSKAHPDALLERVGLAVFQFVDPVGDSTPLREKVATDAREPVRPG